MIDFAFSIFLAFFLVRGVIKGFLSQIASNLGVILGVFLSYRYGLLVSYLFPFSREISKIISYIGVFLIIYLFFFFTGLLLKKFIKAIKLGWVDKIFGGIFGFVKAGLIIFILTFLLKQFNVDLRDKSIVVKEIYKITKFIKEYNKFKRKEI